MLRRKQCKIHYLSSFTKKKEFRKIDENGADITKTKSNVLEFIDRTGFITKSLSNFSINHSEGIHKN